MTDLAALLAEARTIELVDWPHQDVPATLVRAGYAVVAERHPPPAAGQPRFLSHEVVDGPSPLDGITFPLEGGRSHLRFADLAERPPADIVCVYRPAEEQERIVGAAVAAGARAIWIEPGAGVSERARRKAAAAGIVFVDGVSIAQTVRDLAQ